MAMNDGGYEDDQDPNKPVVPGAPVPAPVAAAPAAGPAQAGMWANSQQGFLDWAGHTYGNDPTRGGGFVNAQAGGGLQKMAADYAAASGNKADFLGGPSGDRMDFGQGVTDSLTSGGQIWNPAGAPGGADDGGSNQVRSGSGGAGAPGSGGATGAGGATGSASFSNTSGVGLSDPSGKSNALYELLMRRANQGLNVNANDPVIKNQTDAFDASQQRQQRQYMSGLAEREGPMANISAEARASSEKVGQNTSSFEASLMGREVSERRQEIQQALTGAQGLLTDEQRMQLTSELTQLQMAQRKSEFGSSLEQQMMDRSQRESEFGRNLGQRGYEFDSNDTYRNSPLGS